MDGLANGERGDEAVVECGIAIKRSQHLLGLRIDEALRPLDLNVGLWRALREAAKQPDASASELARATSRTPQALSMLLNRLAERGLVERSAGRGSIMRNRLTDKGQQVLAAADQRADEVVGRAVTQFAPEERAMLTQLVNRFADATADTHNGAQDTAPSTVELGLGLALKRAQHLMAQRIDTVLRPLDLNLGLWAVLREIARTPGASASELARASFHTPQTLSGLVRRLEDRGLVERGEARGRVVDNHLTAAGTDMLTEATQRVEGILASALADFGPAERESLTRMTGSMADTLAREVAS